MTAVSSAHQFVRARQSLLFPILDVALNAFNWGFHVLVSRGLPPQHYAVLNALLALLALFMVLGVALQLLTARHVAAHGLGAARDLQKLAVCCAGAIFGAGVLCLPLLMWLTRANAACVLLVLAIFGMNAVLSVRRGLSQGQTTFLSLNGSFYLEVVVKLAATAFLIAVWPRPEAALLGVFAGMSASLVVSLRGPKLVSQPTSPTEKSAMRLWLSQLAPVFAASFFLYFFSSVDMLMVNRLLPDQAGTYAVAAKYGQILFFAALSVATVFVPQLSRARFEPAKFRALTQKLLGILGAFTLVSLACSFTVFPISVAPVFGAAYTGAGALLPLAVGAYGLLALSFCLVNVLVVLESRSYLWLLFAAATVLVISLFLFHSSPGAVLGVLAIVYGALMFGLGALVLSHKERHATPS